MNSLSETTKQWVFALLLVAFGIGALALRASRLDLRPMHGDEAVHAVKFNQLWTTGHAIYDPHDYHGPIIYYAALPIVALSGARDFGDLSEATLRFVPAFFGAALIGLLWPLAPRLGRKAILMAALLIAISPALSFYARYYIQETPLIFFSMAAIVAALRYFEAANSRQRAIYAFLSGMSIGAAHASKETFVLSLAAAFIAAALTIVWTRRIDGRTIVARFSRRDAAFCLVAAIITSVAFFSSFGTNWRGPFDSIATYTTYFGRAVGDESGALHRQPFDYYIRLMSFSRLAPGPWWSEAVILILAAFGAIAALRGAQSTAERIQSTAEHIQSTAEHIQSTAERDSARVSKTLPRFLVFYALILLLMYSILPYKTPWCVLGWLHPLAIVAGWGAIQMIQSLRYSQYQISFSLLLSIAIAQLAAQSDAANFRFAADRRNPYVYSHPTRDVVRLGERLQALSKVDARGAGLPISIIGDNPWPLPWYTRRLSRVGYSVAPPTQLAAPILIVSPDQSALVLKKLGANGSKRYHSENYGLRPTIIWTLFIERSLWQRFLQHQTANSSS